MGKRKAGELESDTTSAAQSAKIIKKVKHKEETVTLNTKVEHTYQMTA